MVATDNFEMSTYRLSSEYSASELRGYIKQDAYFFIKSEIFWFAERILKFGDMYGDRTRLSLIDSEVVSQRAEHAIIGGTLIVAV